MITVKILADSINASGNRLTTLQVRYPRMVHCFDEQTTILSQIGDELPEFRSFKMVKELDAKVAQFDSNNEQISFIVPKQHYSYNVGENYKGVGFEKNKLSMLVTREHRIFSYRRTTNNAFVPNIDIAENFLNQFNCVHRIPKAGYWHANSKISESEIALMVWFVADGTTYGNKCIFHFKKQRKINEVKNHLLALKINFTERKYNENTVIKFDKPAWVDQCYTEFGKKKLPEEACIISGNKYNVFKNTLFLSDGNLKNQEYNTTSVVLAEQIQTIAALNGDAINLKYCGEGNSRLYKFSFQKTNYIHLRSDKDKFEEMTITGNVYCVTVDTGLVVVKRNGIIFVSGNSEVMTHRVFSRNGRSSRAVPSTKLLKEPIYTPQFQYNKPGMQSTEPMSGWKLWMANFTWNTMAKLTKFGCNILFKLGVHKQWANRPLEWFGYIDLVLSSTEWENFFELRDHKDAQPEIYDLAVAIKKAMAESKPVFLQKGEWHLPYVTDEEKNEMPLSQTKILSVARCARVSYGPHDGNSTYEKEVERFQKLVGSAPIHASPTEHIATPSDDVTKWRNYKGWAQYRGWIEK